MVLIGDCSIFNAFSRLLISACNISVFEGGVLLNSDNNIL